MPFVRSTVIFNKEKSVTYLVCQYKLIKIDNLCVVVIKTCCLYSIYFFIHSRAKRNAYNVYSLYKANNTKGFENKEISNHQLNKKLS